MAVGRSFRVFHKYMQGAPYSLIVENARHSHEFLLLESGVVATLNSKECAEFKDQYQKVMDSYGCLGILQVQGSEGPLQYLAMVTACVSVGKIGECDVYRITGVQFLPMWAPPAPGSAMDERVYDIQKLVSSGTFFFAWSAQEDAILDLSLSAQKRSTGSISDNRFFWNRSLHLPLQRYGVDTRVWLLRCICGGVEIKTVYVGAVAAKACLISRLSCERMGTRFNVRGVNDDGHAANFVETEQVIFYDKDVVSFVQIRGSIPLFWEQPGVQVGSHKVKLSRGFEASAPAYDKHFKILKHFYGDQVVVNLLGNKEGERVVSQAFKMHHEHSSHIDDVPFISFDYHSMVRVGNKVQNLVLLWNKVKDSIAKFGFFHAKDNEIIRQQTGTLRTNCLDCLDRTNCAQLYFAFQVLSQQIQSLALEKPNIKGRFEQVFQQLWQHNGDQCSRIYAGTGALEGKSKIKDAGRSVTRTIQNNLMDGSKQEAMDIFLLGTALSPELYDRASSLLPLSLLHGASIITACPNVLISMVEKRDEFTVPQTLRLFCGTWNVNGGTRFDSVAFRGKESLSDWLLDLTEKSKSNKLVDLVHDTSGPVDIYAVGLEEIVDLNASNIMSASTTNQRKWAEHLKKTLCRDHKYIMITSIQLVGVCIFIFIRPHLAPYLRELSTDEVKTGLGGAAGNKGCVAVRFQIHSTSFCFLASHFAAGQSQVQDRNNDFAETCRRIRFPMGRTVFCHDFIFWLGDFNYRIDLKGDEVKKLVSEGNLEPLKEADQLANQKAAGNTFNGFFEGVLQFPPTYKYDTFSDDYDTSEKCRCPAWTDRILWWQRPTIGEPQLPTPGNQCRQLLYARAELKTSDHRPVGALFDVEVREVDHAKQEEVYREVVGCMGPPDATVLVSSSLPSADGAFPMDLVDGVLAKVAELGIQVLLVKFVGTEMWLMFKDGEMALAALSMDGCKIGEVDLVVKLRSANWEEDCRGELESCKWLAGNMSYTLLDEDNKDTEELDLDFEGDEPELQQLSISQQQGAPDGAGQWSGRSTPQGDNPKKAPPPRPAPPPKRPPPPMSQTSCPPGNSQSATQFQRPVSMVSTKLSHGVIGYPTDVSHVGAKTPEEAEKLILSLSNRQSVGGSTFYTSPPADPDWGEFLTSRAAAPPLTVDDWTNEPDPFAPTLKPQPPPRKSPSNNDVPQAAPRQSKSKETTPTTVEDPWGAAPEASFSAAGFTDSFAPPTGPPTGPPPSIPPRPAGYSPENGVPPSEPVPPIPARRAPPAPN